MNAFFNPWGAGVVASAINHLLEQQPSARAALALHQGAVFRIVPTGPLARMADHLAVDFTVLEDGRLSPGATEPPRVS